MQATTAKQVLIATKWILTHYGWCKNKMFVSHPKPTASPGHELLTTEANLQKGDATLESACLAGALSLVENTKEARRAAWHMITDATGGSMAHWNDQPGRTKRDVITLLEHLIKKA